jgi:hypothetical protein
MGVCLAVAVAATVCRGACLLVYACRSVGVPVTAYLGRAVLPTVVVTAGPAAVFGFLTSRWTPDTWLSLSLCAGIYALIYLPTAGLGLFGVEVWRELARAMTNRLDRSAQSSMDPAVLAGGVLEKRRPS